MTEVTARTARSRSLPVERARVHLLRTHEAPALQSEPNHPGARGIERSWHRGLPGDDGRPRAAPSPSLGALRASPTVLAGSSPHGRRLRTRASPARSSRSSKHDHPGEPAQRVSVVAPPPVRASPGPARSLLLVVADRVDGDPQLVCSAADRQRSSGLGGASEWHGATIALDMVRTPGFRLVSSGGLWTPGEEGHTTCNRQHWVPRAHDIRSRAGVHGHERLLRGADEATSVAAIRRALDLGVTLFDTAEAYGPFLNERLLGRALGADRESVTVATKFAIEFDDDGTPRGLNGSPATRAAPWTGRSRTWELTTSTCTTCTASTRCADRGDGRRDGRARRVGQGPLHRCLRDLS